MPRPRPWRAAEHNFWTFSKAAPCERWAPGGRVRVACRLLLYIGQNLVGVAENFLFLLVAGSVLLNYDKIV